MQYQHELSVAQTTVFVGPSCYALKVRREFSENRNSYISSVNMKCESVICERLAATRNEEKSEKFHSL